MAGRIGVAVLGVGKLGAIHAAHLAEMPGVQVVAVADPALSRAREVGERIGAKAFGEPLEALASSGVEAVVIASSTDTHAPLIRAAVAGRKACFCEKPLSLSLHEATALADEVDKSGVPFQIGFMRRYDPGYVAMKERLLAGEIGEVVAVRSISRDPEPPPESYVAVSGGIFRDQLIHDFDLVRFLVGEVAEVYTVGTVRAYPFFEKYGDVEEAMVSLSFHDGTIGQLEGTRASGYGYDIDTEVLGTRGALRVRQIAASALTVAKQGFVREPTMPGWVERFDEAYRLELVAFIEGLQSGRALGPTAYDGLTALQIAEAAAESLQTRQPIKVKGQGRSHAAEVAGR